MHKGNCWHICFLTVIRDPREWYHRSQEFMLQIPYFYSCESYWNGMLRSIPFFYLSLIFFFVFLCLFHWNNLTDVVWTSEIVRSFLQHFFEIIRWIQLENALTVSVSTIVSFTSFIEYFSMASWRRWLEIARKILEGGSLKVTGEEGGWGNKIVNRANEIGEK